MAAIRILAVLKGRDRIPGGLTQIAREVGMYNGTCDDILHTLESHGYVIRDPKTRGYLLGPELVSLGAMAVSDPDYVEVALERLLAVRDCVKASCHLVRLIDADQIQVVGRLDVPFGFGVSAQVGERFPLSVSRGSGRTFLAWMAEAERRATFERLAGQGFLAEFGRDWRKFEEDMARVRAQGYAVARFDYADDDIHSDIFAFLTAPIFDPAGRVALVASVVPFGSRAAPELLPGHAACLVATTRGISQAIGGSLPEDYPREAPAAAR
jgi:DNA-binding IclR family transcriptional regulator